jgi:hypothetical protein
MKEHRDIIKSLGGAANVAEKLGMKRQTVTMWMLRGIAAEFRPAVYALAKESGVEIDPELLFPPTFAALLKDDAA